MEGMTIKEFKQLYNGGHTEMSALDTLVKGRNGSLVKKSSCDTKLTSFGKIEGKNAIEKRCFEERAEKFKHYVMDAVAVRNQDILDREQISMSQLLGIVVKTLPQKQEVKMEGNFTFADMVKKASIEFNAVDTIDADGRSDE